MWPHNLPLYSTAIVYNIAVYIIRNNHESLWFQVMTSHYYIYATRKTSGPKKYCSVIYMYVDG